MEKSRRENINSRFAIVISCFETTLNIVSTVFGRFGQMLGALAMMAGTIARLYEPTPESPAAAVADFMPMAGRKVGIANNLRNTLPHAAKCVPLNNLNRRPCL